MKYRRMPIEIELPEQLGYGSIRCNLTDSSVTDTSLEQMGIEIDRAACCWPTPTMSASRSCALCWPPTRPG